MKHLFGVEGATLALAAIFDDPVCCFTARAIVRWEHAAFL